MGFLYSVSNLDQDLDIDRGPENMMADSGVEIVTPLLTIKLALTEQDLGQALDQDLAQG